MFNKIKKKENLNFGEDLINKNFTYILIAFYSFVLIILLYILWKITYMKKVEDPF